MSGYDAGIRQQALNLFEDLLVLEQVLPDGPGRTRGHARPAAFAKHLVDPRLLLLLLVRDRLVRAERKAGLAAGAGVLQNVSRVRLQFDNSRVD